MGVVSLPPTDDTTWQGSIGASVISLYQRFFEFKITYDFLIIYGLKNTCRNSIYIMEGNCLKNSEKMPIDN